MTIQTGITVNRKALANRISQELLGAPVTYAGVPSCAYRVGACITIDRAGNIEITNDDATKILMPFFIEQGWTSAEPTMEPTADFEAETQDETTASESMEAHDEVTAVEPTDTPAEAPAAEHMEISAEEANEPTEPTVNDEAAAEDLKAPTETHQVPEHTAGIDPTQISIPVELTVAQLTNLVHMLYSQQRLLNKAAMDGRLTIPQGLIARLTEYTPESPEAFAELLSDFIAMDELAGFEYDGGIVKMDFPFDDTHPERWTAYAGLVGRIIQAAKTAHRVKAELQDSENEKYYMRAWLLRLGYCGADLKDERRLLLRNLNGHSAFPNDAAAEKHKEKYAALRRVDREANANAE